MGGMIGQGPAEALVREDPELGVLMQTYPDQRERFTFLYESLSIIDSKASSLLAFNAIGLTALAVWLEYIPPNWLHFTLDVVFVMLLVSCGACLWTVKLFWSPHKHFEDPKLQTRTLLDTRNRRTQLYRFSWRVSFAGVAIILIVSAFHGVGTFLHASGRCGGTCSELYSESEWGNRELPTEPAPSAAAGSGTPVPP